MEILRNFGFDPVMLAAQIINFLIILYLLKRFLYKPVFAMLKKRSDAVLEGIRQSEEARKTLEKTLEQEKIILAKAKDEARQIVEDSKTQAVSLTQEIEVSSKTQTEKMIAEAVQRIEQESKETERRLSEKVSLLAKDMLTKSLEGVFEKKQQQQIVNKALKKIKKVN